MLKTTWQDITPARLQAAVIALVIIGWIAILFAITAATTADDRLREREARETAQQFENAFGD